MDKSPTDKNPKNLHAEREERVLTFWKEKGIFEKSLNKKSPRGEFVFYDGPPFATGLPHYGSLLPSIIKDVVPRWKTMQGYYVRRRWGWDCHGLPVENLIEKELGLKSKKDILEYGIGRFNEAAKNSVLRYADEWKKQIPRMGRWADMDNDYRTMDATYTESVWWIFKKLYDKGLIYEGFKSMNLCPHCETTLSNFEVAQGYKDITDISVYVKFKVKDSYLLVWTTTPWTLPGNVALAVNPNIEYLKVKIDGALFILAKSRLNVLKDKKYEIIETTKGSNLIGLSYEPPFDYYSEDANLKNRNNGWKIYGANFVTTEDGTGIVHIAPAFGSDDYELSIKHNLPFIQPVAVDGTFKKEVRDFAGLKVKPIDIEENKNAHQKTDVEIIEWLDNRNKLFEKEKVIHPYPHCWRCYTPLLNYAASSWFVKVTAIKDKLIKANKKIVWVPEEVGKYRFGNWLDEARDWAISRTRFWGAPIPVWRERKTDVCHILGSAADLKKFSRAKNTYYVMRHGEAENNVLGILSGIPDFSHHLTARGREEIICAAESLNKIKFDLIFVSPFIRAMETIQILKEKLDWTDDKIHVDNRIRELGTGVWNAKKISDFVGEFKHDGRFDRGPEGGENYADIKKRMGDFLYDLEDKYSGKTILVITHETPLFLLVAAARGLNRKQSLNLRGEADFIDNAKALELDFVPLPHNAEYELDLHRPFIDEVKLCSPEGNELIRVPDVFDCWFESGSMPYGEAHYPFENLAEFNPDPGFLKKPIRYPADFIAEGLDQTRGWFYSMLVLGVALFGKSPYKKVLVNGLVLAEDGQKMSKSKQNYPDPMLIAEKYGADSLRYYMTASPVVRARDLCFSEHGVDEVAKKIVNRLLNVVSFYEMYQRPVLSQISSTNILDRWIISRLNQTILTVTQGLEKGELDKAAGPIEDFIDDLSTWYLRRSRERFKSGDGADKNDALETTRFVLVQTAKLLAPFMPFLAEDIYLRLKGGKESVHLEDWPRTGAVDLKLIGQIKETRLTASQGLEARMAAKINVRQPLAKLKIQNLKLKTLSPQFIELIKDEVNVKEVVFDDSIKKGVELDVTITPELKEEGTVRELIRVIQDLRKEKGLTVNDRVTLTVEIDDSGRGFIEKNKKKISSATLLININYGNASGESLKIGDISLKIELKK